MYKIYIRIFKMRSCFQVDVVSQVGSKAGIGSKVGVLDTVRNLLDRSCPLLIDANCVKILVTKVLYNDMPIPREYAI